ncbi:MAG: hypothetical protein U9O65_02790, partial [Thermotogota bacterium]|nr:hypothetical protein [Thermotogota bacterium]
MARISTQFNNFSFGKIDHRTNGRFDLPIYHSGADVVKNFFTNFQGNAIYRPGFESISKFEDCRFIEFKFNNEQSYLCLFYNTKIKFLSYDAGGNLGFVQSGGADLEVATPYSLAESKELKYDQNADVMVIVHPSYEPRKLTRVSATNFTLSTFARTADPFTGAGDYPSCVRYYKGRIYYANTNNKPTTMWGSQVADYDNMTTGTNDDDGLEFAIADITEEIEWLMGGNNSLIAGSSEAIAAINGGTPDDPITPTTVEASVTNTDGSNTTQPIRKEDLLFYIRRDSRACDYFSYDLLTESFKSHDANKLSYEITQEKISRLVYKKDRDNLIFTLRGDHALLTLNFNLEEKIIGWHEHFAGNDDEFHDIS